MQLRLCLLLHLLADCGDGGFFGLARAEFLLQDLQLVEKVGLQGQLPLRLLAIEFSLVSKSLLPKKRFLGLERIVLLL